MSRHNPLHSVFRLALEVALVVGVVSLLPRVNLTGHKTDATEAPASNATPFLSTGKALDASGDWMRDRRPEADARPRLTPITALPASSLTAPLTPVRDTLMRDTADNRAGAGKSQAPSIPQLIGLENGRQTSSAPAGPELTPPTGNVPASFETAGQPSSASSQYAEQRLDRASQALLNGLGSYLARAAGELLKGDDGASQTRSTATIESRERLQPAPPSTSTKSPYVIRAQSNAASPSDVALPPLPERPAFSAPLISAPSTSAPTYSTPSVAAPATYTAPATYAAPTQSPSASRLPAATSAPQVTFQLPTGTIPTAGGAGSFPTESALPAARPAAPSTFRQWRNY